MDDAVGGPRSSAAVIAMRGLYGVKCPYFLEEVLFVTGRPMSVMQGPLP